MLTRSGVDVELRKLLHRNTLWVTWTELAELAMRPAAKSRTERLLSGQFYRMLETKGIPMISSITTSDYGKLKLLNKLIASKNTKSLHRNSIEVIASIMSRLDIFANDSWECLTKNGYKPFARLYAFRPSKSNGVVKPCAEVEVGFQLWKNRKRVRGRYLFLGINCEDQRLYVWGGWHLGRGHPNYDSGTWGKEFKKWSLRESRLLFKNSLPDARRAIHLELEGCLKKFKKSRYFNS
jgi:hypothetical protein